MGEQEGEEQAEESEGDEDSAWEGYLGCLPSVQADGLCVHSFLLWFSLSPFFRSFLLPSPSPPSFQGTCLATAAHENERTTEKIRERAGNSMPLTLAGRAVAEVALAHPSAVRAPLLVEGAAPPLGRDTRAATQCRARLLAAVAARRMHHLPWLPCSPATWTTTVRAPPRRIGPRPPTRSFPL